MRVELSEYDYDFFDRVHRFVRLWRKLGWTVEELDMAIMAVGPSWPDIDAETLERLAHLVRQQELLDLPLATIVSWWGGEKVLLYAPHVARDGDPKSLYERIFLAPLAQSPADPDFLLNANRTGLAVAMPAGTLKYKAQVLCAALGISPDDLTAMLSGLALGDLTLNNLAVLYRNVGLVKALDLSAADFFRLVALTGCDPFYSTASLIEFCEAAIFVRDSGFGAEELAYLLLDEMPAGSQHVMNEEAAAIALQKIRGAAQAQLNAIDSQITDLITNHGGGPTILKRLIGQEAVAADAGSVSVGYVQGDSASAVTSSLVLAKCGANGTAIEWVSSSSAIAKGADFPNYSVWNVTRPSNDDDDLTVTLTAILKANEPSTVPVRRDFDIVVLKQPIDDHAAVAAAVEAISIGYTIGDGPSSVTGDLILPSRGINNTSITWASTSSVISKRSDFPASTVWGVNRPSSNGSDVSVTLVANVSVSGGNPITRQFIVTVPKRLSGDAAVKADAAALSIGYAPGDCASAVTTDLVLPGRGSNGSTITWRSGDETVVSIAQDSALPECFIGTVKRPEGATRSTCVALYATIASTAKDTDPINKAFYSPVLLTASKLDSNRLQNILPDPGLRQQLIDVILGAASDLLGLEWEVVRQLLVSSTGVPAILSVMDSSGTATDGIDAFIDPLLIGAGPDSVFDSTTFASVFAMVLRLHKVALILAHLVVKPVQIPWLGNQAANMITLDLNALPVTGGGGRKDCFPDWQRLVTLFQIRDSLAGMDDLLEDYLEGLRVQALAQGLAITIDALQAAAEKLGASYPADYRDPLVLKQILSLFYAMRKLGADIDDFDVLVADWTASDATSSTPDTATQAEKCARALLRAKYGADSWRDIVKPISDSLRIKQRDALVDYVVGMSNRPDNNDPYRKGFRDTEDLYEYFLIDPQMSPGMLTSRLVQATAAVQLFVQQCLLGIVQNVTLNADDRKRWEWIKNYRVWQANREVFLFPENWLYPELRDDKTEIFKQTEGALGQSELNYQLAKENFLGYMDGLAEVGKVAVYGMYEYLEVIDDETTRSLYVVGRSPNQPYRYFWRKCTALTDSRRMSWSGWEEIDMDISDDHVMPFVMDGNFHIAWPTITQKSNNNDPNSKSPANYWEIKLNWARYTKKGWTQKKISRDALPMAGDFAKTLCRPDINDPNREISFRVTSDPSQPDSRFFNVYSVQTTYTPPPSVLSPAPAPDCEPDDPPDEMSFDSVLLKDYDFLRYFMSRDKYGPDNILSPSVFTVNLYNRYRDACGREYYGPAERQQVIIRVFYRLYPSGPEIEWNKSNEVMSEGIGGGYTYTLVWKDFEDIGNVNGQAKYLSRVSFSLKSAAGETPIRTYVPVHVPVSYRCGHIIDAVWPSYTEYAHIGSFALMPDGDMVVGAGRHVSLPDRHMAIYANGYRYNDGAADLQLRVDKDGSVGSFVPITLSSITGQARQRLLMPSAMDNGILDLHKEDSVWGECLWYYEDELNKLYVLGLVIGSNWDLTLSTLAIRDHIHDTAALRKLAYSNFETLFTPAVQQTLQQQNFYADCYFGTSGSNDNGKGFKDLDLKSSAFAVQTPSAPYNWEIFYHLPMLIGECLTKHQRFEDARRWLHAIFNPTATIPSGTAPQTEKNRCWWFWQLMPFQDKGESLQELFSALAKLAKNPQDTSVDTTAITNFDSQIYSWLRNPFSPFAVARYRWSAFQWRTLFAYLNNLIEWGDQTFRQFTRESVNEATQYYVLASMLLGPRPTSLRPQREEADLSYRDVYAKWDDFSRAWHVITDAVSGVIQGNSSDAGEGQTEALTALGMAYFSVPHNDRLLEYWDKVEDRLFKVRNCMDIDGVPRELALFAPRIDPAILIRATAAGIDISTVLADLSAPLLPYRFSVLLQKANELCAEVKSLGAELLSTLEKKDAEELACLRASHEVAMIKRVTNIKEQQIKEADANLEVLTRAMAAGQEKFSQYQKLLGKAAASSDQSGLPVLTASSSLRVASNAAGEVAGLGLIQHEVDQLNSLEEVHAYQEAAGIASTVAGVLHAIPESQTGAICQYLHIGGMHFGNAANAAASFFTLLSTNASHEANRKGMFATYLRRQDEWVFQSKLALAEMKQIEKQIAVAQIRRDIAVSELENHLAQVAQAQAVKDFMHEKYTNHELYSWMTGQVSAVYFASYQLAYDMAKRAECAFRNERGLTDSSFIQFGYWDSLKKGLLSAENLSLDLKRMEVAYLEQNRRELEIAKNVSLQQLYPLALIDLKEKGVCEVELPEALFDIDFPGHYFRRIKSVSITIPCVVGPYTGVNCTLTLLKHSYRISAHVGADGYGRKYDPESPDSRFLDATGAVQSIACSHSQSDSGMFELNFRDERYLPFEGAGAVSRWRVELPREFPAFDYATISDVVLHLKYTARDGGRTLKDAANKELKAALNALVQDQGKNGFMRLFSVKNEFANDWQRFMGDITPGLHLTITRERFPFMFRGRRIAVSGEADLYVFAKSGAGLTHTIGKVAVTADVLTGEWKISSSDASLDAKDIYDVAIICYYRV